MSTMVASPSRADRERAERRTPDRSRRRGGDGRDQRIHVDAQHQELGHRGEQIERGAVDVEHVHVARDDVGTKPGREQAAAGVEAERAGAVADVEGHAALAREQRFLAHARRRRAAANWETAGSSG